MVVGTEALVDVLKGDGDRGAFGLGIGGDAPGGRDVNEEVRDGDDTEGY